MTNSPTWQRNGKEKMFFSVWQNGMVKNVFVSSVRKQNEIFKKWKLINYKKEKERNQTLNVSRSFLLFDIVLLFLHI